MTFPYPRCWAEIDAVALGDNVRRLRALGSQIMAVVKADAYGHGANLIVPELARLGVRHFGVASVAEGQAVRAMVEGASAGNSAIYVMAAVLPEEAGAVLATRLTPFVSDFALAQALSRAAAEDGRTAEIHVEIDTGIGRAGIAMAEAASFLAACDALQNLQIMGICTHFTAADAADPRDSERQYALFERALSALPSARLATMTLHAANSPAALRLPKSRLQLMRPGLLLYGTSPSTGFAPGFAYRPVLSLKARVLLVRRLPAGADISYGRTYRLSRPATIATVGIGYGDGYPRRLSNIGFVMLPGAERAPIRGRICMDQFCVEAPEETNLAVGDTVTLIGREGAGEITVNELAEQVQTTPHEITTCLTTRVPRILVGA